MVLKVAVNPVAPKAVQPVVLSPVDPLALKAAKVVKAAKVAQHRMQARVAHLKTGLAQWPKPAVDRAPKPLTGLRV